MPTVFTKNRDRLLTNTAKRITSRVEEFAADPQSQASNVKALQGRDGIRHRVGDWRVIMLDDEVLDVLEINPRGSAY